MVALAKPAPKTREARAKQAAKERAAYIKNTTILIEGQRARVTSQFGGEKHYDVKIVEGKAASCTCPDRQIRKTYCKHMEATDARLALPQLPAGVAKFRTVRGQAKLVAVPVVVPTAKEESTKKNEETPKPTETRRRTAKLTKPVETTILDRHETDGDVMLLCSDTTGTACTVTLRRTKRHECTCGSHVTRCCHIEHCRSIENARWQAKQAEEDAQAVAEKIVEDAQPAPDAKKCEVAPLNGAGKQRSFLNAVFGGTSAQMARYREDYVRRATS